MESTLRRVALKSTLVLRSALNARAGGGSSIWRRTYGCRHLSETSFSPLFRTSPDDFREANRTLARPLYGVRLPSHALLRTARLERKFKSGLRRLAVDTITLIGCLRQCRPDLFEAFPTRSTGTNRTADQTAAIRPANNPVITFVTHADAHFEKSLLEGSKANSCSTQAKRFSI